MSWSPHNLLDKQYEIRLANLINVPKQESKGRYKVTCQLEEMDLDIMDKAGVSIKAIQLILRHKNISTTSNYLHSLRGVKTDLGQAFSQKEILRSKSGSED